MPIHTAGAWAVASAAPSADVVLLAQTGLEDLLAAVVPLDYPPLGTGTIHTAWWHTPAEQIPRDRDAFTAWLNETWCAVDAWIGETRSTELGANPSPANFGT